MQFYYYFDYNSEKQYVLDFAFIQINAGCNFVFRIYHSRAFVLGSWSLGELCSSKISAKPS